MLDGGLQFTLLTDSIVLRAILASVVAVVLARSLLRTGLQSAGVRAAAAVVPSLALVMAVLVAGRASSVPSFLSEAGSAEGVIFSDISMSWFRPVAVGALLSAWFVVSVTRIGLRLWRVHRHSASVLADAVGAPSRLRQEIADLAVASRVPAPRSWISPACSGGAAVIGVRSPQLVIDAQLLESLDIDELRGVLAHELAHVRRRDNLVALALGIVRDIMFFVPLGGRWALRQLHSERELAADEAAVALTNRPAALASGLMKVIDQASASCPAAAFVAEGTLVRRVEALVDNASRPSRLRVASETGALLTAVIGAVTIAAVLPPAMSDIGPKGVMFQYLGSADAQIERPVFREPVAFDVYRSTSLGPLAAETPVRADGLDDLATEAACFRVDVVCAPVAPSSSLRWQPTPSVVVAPLDLINEPRFRARALVGDGNRGFSVYVLTNLGDRIR